MTVLTDYISPTEAGARLNVCSATAVRRAKAGQLPGVLIGGRLLFRRADIEKAAENCRPRTESDSLEKIVEVLVADDPAPTPPPPVYDDKGLEVLGRLPKIRHQVFRMGKDGERVLVREKFIDPPPPEDKPAEAEKKEEKN
jgi:hypothetical protein